ncbi:MBL fold metallo-hydrolase [Candidatus Berkelbacteria bacterium]|nr:MBL fold metallo-hydrolase [Candidatus Berkelbacteria bacterium]
MVIIAKADDRFEIKTKTSTILTGETVSINGVELVGPGEYEIGDCKITGIPASPAGRPSSVYLVESEDLRIAYLDRLSSMLSEDQIEALSEPDILFVPTGAHGTLDPKSAERLVALIDPKIVIPMLGDIASVVKQLGGKSEELNQLKITRQTLPQDGRRLVVLKP